MRRVLTQAFLFVQNDAEEQVIDLQAAVVRIRPTALTPLLCPACEVADA